MSYSSEDLKKKLEEMGVKQGDTIMVHSGWSTLNGFQGTMQDVIKVFKEAIGFEQRKPFNGFHALRGSCL